MYARAFARSMLETKQRKAPFLVFFFFFFLFLFFLLLEKSCTHMVLWWSNADKTIIFLKVDVMNTHPSKHVIKFPAELSAT